MDTPAVEATAVPPPPPTGQSEIDAALAEVASLDDLPVTEHPARLAAAHETLRAALREGPPNAGGATGP